MNTAKSKNFAFVYKCQILRAALPENMNMDFEWLDVAFAEINVYTGMISQFIRKKSYRIT